MELKAAIEGRRSVRKFAAQPVPKEDLLELIRLASQAPSAGNAQMWHFVVVTGKDKIAELAAAVGGKLSEFENNPEMAEFKDAFTRMRYFTLLFKDAPVVIAVLKEPYHGSTEAILAKSGKTPEEIKEMRSGPDIQSVGAAIQNLLLAAHEMGYGTCWMTGSLYAKPELEKVLGVQPPRTLCALIPLGKPAETPPARPRKPVEEIVTWL